MMCAGLLACCLTTHKTWSADVSRYCASDDYILITNVNTNIMALRGKFAIPECAAMGFSGSVDVNSTAMVQ